MIECLTPEQLYMFIALLDNTIIEYREPITVIIHATTEEVHWIYNDVSKLFCHKE